MKKLRSLLGHAGAVATLAVALISPFLLYGWFQKLIASSGVRIHPTFTGGEVARTIDRGSYRIAVYRPVGRGTPMQRVDPFIQMAWTPAASLPAAVSDEIDLDGDGAADVRVAFRTAAMDVDVTSLNGKYRAMHSRGVTSFSALIARVDDRVVVRLPVE